MYAELKRKKCKYCGKTKSHSEFQSFKKNEKLYPRPFCKECKKQGNFEWDIWKLYRIRLPEYNKLYSEQRGCCACCGKSERAHARRLHIDHDRDTGIIRGLLCTQCNPGIGYFQHSIDRLRMAIIYLEKFKK